jgi:hypothetical protein
MASDAQKCAAKRHTFDRKGDAIALWAQHAEAYYEQTWDGQWIVEVRW